MAFTQDKVIGATPLRVQFTDTTVGDVVAWEWNFGDGNASYDQNPVHIYRSAGFFTVVLTVTYSNTTTEVFTQTDLIVVDDGGITSSTLCLRYATEKREGAGWSEFGGVHWVLPMDNWGCFNIIDTNDISRALVIDKSDYEIYEIDTCDRVVYIEPAWIDKEGVADAEISWEKWERELILRSSEEIQQVHEMSYVNIRPIKNERRGASGYTATGQRLAQQISLAAYKDGEKVTSAASSSNIPENGEIVFSGMDRTGNRLQMVVSGSASEIHVTSHIHKFLMDMRAPSRTRRNMTEHDIQRELSSDKEVHISRGYIPLFNRAKGTTLGAGIVTKIAGPDGGSNSALSFTADLTLDNEAIVGDYTIIIWAKTGTLISGETFTQQGDAVLGWAMWYATGTGLTASKVVGLGQKFDIRIYRKAISSNALAALYEDVLNHSGKMLLPRA